MRLCFWLDSIPRQEQLERRGTMKQTAHAHTTSIYNRQFGARIARKDRGHFNEVGRKKLYLFCIFVKFIVLKMIVPPPEYDKKFTTLIIAVSSFYPTFLKHTPPPPQEHPSPWRYCLLCCYENLENSKIRKLENPKIRYFNLKIK